MNKTVRILFSDLLDGMREPVTEKWYSTDLNNFNEDNFKEVINILMSRKNRKDFFKVIKEMGVENVLEIKEMKDVVDSLQLNHKFFIRFKYNGIYTTYNLITGKITNEAANE